MDLHLFTTDCSALDLIGRLPGGDRVVCLVVPENRTGSDKVARLGAAAGALPVRMHRSGSSLDADLPPAEGGIGWLYSQIILAGDLGRYPAGVLNMHGGSIPEYRGANVLNWTVINGEEELGVTWHGLVEEVDAGPIWAESRIPIPRDWTAAELREAMIREGIRLFPEAWRRFRDGAADPRYPDLGRGRVWPGRKPRDGRIGPGWPERRVRDMVRALCPPWPPATIKVGDGWIAVSSVLEAPEAGAIPYETSGNRTVYLRPQSSDGA